MENKIYLSLLSIVSLILSCKGPQPEQTSETADSGVLNTVQFTAEKKDAAGITTGKIEKTFFRDFIECNGTIEASPNNRAQISPPMKGYITHIYVHFGEYVSTDQILATLTHPDYILLQKNYLETKSEYDYFKQDFQRQGELTLDQATSLKTMQRAEKDFKKTEARLYAYQHQLRYLGIDPDSLTVETMHPEIKIVSPLSGFITSIDASMGMLCPEEEVIFEIVNNKALMLHLKVYERDAQKAAPGDEVQFSLLSDPTQIYAARLLSSTNTIDDQNTIGFHAKIFDKADLLLPGMYVRAKIITFSDSVYALSAGAIITQNNQPYIFQEVDSMQYRSVKITTGRTVEDKVEILSTDEELLEAEIVLDGAYYLQAEMMDNE